MDEKQDSKELEDLCKTKQRTTVHIYLRLQYRTFPKALKRKSEASFPPTAMRFSVSASPAFDEEALLPFIFLCALTDDFDFPLSDPPANKS